MGVLEVQTLRVLTDTQRVKSERARIDETLIDEPAPAVLQRWVVVIRSILHCSLPSDASIRRRKSCHSIRINETLR